MSTLFKVGDIVKYDAANGSIGRVVSVRPVLNRTRLYVQYVYGLDVKGEEMKSSPAAGWAEEFVAADLETYDAVRMSQPPVWGPRGLARSRDDGRRP